MTDATPLPNPWAIVDRLDRELWSGWIDEAFRSKPSTQEALSISRARFRARDSLSGAATFRATWQGEQRSRRSALPWLSAYAANVIDAANAAERLGLAGVGYVITARGTREAATSLASAAAQGAETAGVVRAETIGDEIAGAAAGAAGAVGGKGLGLGLGLALGAGALLLVFGPVLGRQASRAVGAARGQ